MEERVRLEKAFKPANIWAIALGTIIGFGCFILPGDWLGQAGPLGAAIGLALGGCIMLFIGKSYGFMVKTFPVAGGEFAYSYKGFGRNHAFVCGWLLSLAYLCIVPVNATALAILAKFVAPDLFTRGLLYSIAGSKIYTGEIILATSTILLFGYFNYRGAKLVGNLQLLMVLLLVGAVIMLGVGTVLRADNAVKHIQPFFAPGQLSIVSILLILAIAPWAFCGFDTIPQAAEEFSFSPDKALKLIILAIAFAAVMYVTVIISTAAVFPWEGFIAGKPVWATGAAMKACMGNFGLTVLIVGVVMAMCTGINGFYVATSRLLFSMARAKVLPAWFAKVHPVHKTPGNAIIFIMVVSLSAPWFGRQVLLWIVEMSATGTSVGYLYTCLSAWFLSKSLGTGSTRFTHLLAALFSAGFLVLLCVPGLPTVMKVPTWIAFGVWITMGVTFYLIQGKEYRAIPKQQLDRLILDAPAKLE